MFRVYSIDCGKHSSHIFAYHFMLPTDKMLLKFTLNQKEYLFSIKIFILTSTPVKLCIAQL